MQRVVLVGLELLAEPVARMVGRHGASDFAQVESLAALPTEEPAVIIVPQSLLGDEQQAVQALRQRWPKLAATVIVLELPWAMRVLERPSRATSRWRRRPLGELDRELARRLARIELLQDIGYYDLVVSSGHEYHVQTEVVRAADGDIVVRTTVLEGGTVSFARSAPYPLAACGDLPRGRAIVEQQHREVVAQLGG